MSAFGSQLLYPPYPPVAAASGSPLLGQADALLRARPLRSWSVAQKETVCSRLAAAHGAWCAEWLTARGDARHEATVQVDEEGLGVPADAACWSYAAGSAAAPRRSAVHAIAGELFGLDMSTLGPQRETPAVASAVVQAAWNDWLQRLQELLAPVPMQQHAAGPVDPGQASHRWSGTLYPRWPWCGGLWQMALPHGAVAALLGEDAAQPAASPPRSDSSPRQRLDQALGNHRLTLRATLGDIELDLGQLQSLRPGDIVPLAHPLDAPVRLAGADGTPVCEGWLGQLDGRVAIELSLPASAPTMPAASQAPTHLAKKGTP